MKLALKAQTKQLQDDYEKLWQAVIARDGSFDGQFVYAVSSTGIYCRPSCPSRRPMRERVSFFSLPEAAEQAGFRACQRCDPKDVQTAKGHIQMVQNACRIIEETDGETINLEVLSKRLGYSSFHLQRTFKAMMGITPRQYGESCRTNRFKSGIRKGESITSAMYDAGYGSSSRLYERAKVELGMTPATYSRSGRETTINYAVAKSPLGYLLVAATDKGVCAVRLGDTVATLEASLHSEFRQAQIRKSNKTLVQIVNQILEHLAGNQPHLDLPLDLRATAFQRQVWEALRSIPYGDVKSYAEIARKIGQPKAVRAVARACATNPAALVIPCHRVIRGDKTLGGYRWGIERKKKLLDKEQAMRKRKAAL